MKGARLEESMREAWREYGAIAVLLVVSVGGYLYLSRSEEDLVARTVETIGAHLLALVPETEAKDRTRSRLAEFEARAAERDLSPEQIERLAASVLNLHSSGAQLAPEEAEMMLELALSDQDALPAPADAVLPAPEAARTPARKPRRSELVASAERVDRMLQVFSTVRSARAAEPALDSLPPVRFYADGGGGLRAVVDERLREEWARAGDEANAQIVAWQSHLAESVKAESERLAEEARAWGSFSVVIAESLAVESAESRSLAVLKKLEAHGFLFQPEMESLAVRLEHRLEDRIGKPPRVRVGEPDENTPPTPPGVRGGGSAASTSGGTTAAANARASSNGG